MYLWILKPNKNLSYEDDLWSPWYDKTFGVVVRAESEDKARKLASTACGDEGSKAWLDAKYSSCLRLLDEGEESVVITDLWLA